MYLYSPRAQHINRCLINIEGKKSEGRRGRKSECAGADCPGKSLGHTSPVIRRQASSNSGREERMQSRRAEEGKREVRSVTAKMKRLTLTLEKRAGRGAGSSGASLTAGQLFSTSPFILSSSTASASLLFQIKTSLLEVETCSRPNKTPTSF